MKKLYTNFIRKRYRLERFEYHNKYSEFKKELEDSLIVLSFLALFLFLITF